MAQAISRPLVYHASTSEHDRIEILCRAMRQTLMMYNDLAEDSRDGKIDDDWDSFVDFDTYDDYEVSEVKTPFARLEHKVPDDFEGLVVTHGYTAIAEVRTLDDGADLIRLCSGRRVRLVEEKLPHGRCWLPYPIDGGPGDAPVEPVPTGPVRRPVLA